MTGKREASKKKAKNERDVNVEDCCSFAWKNVHASASQLWVLAECSSYTDLYALGNFVVGAESWVWYGSPFVWW
jgi:hypothetical protein